jgi:hypothetical protein
LPLVVAAYGKSTPHDSLLVRLAWETFSEAAEAMGISGLALRASGNPRPRPRGHWLDEVGGPQGNSGEERFIRSLEKMEKMKE